MFLTPMQYSSVDQHKPTKFVLDAEKGAHLNLRHVITFRRELELTSIIRFRMA